MHPPVHRHTSAMPGRRACVATITCLTLSCGAWAQETDTWRIGGVLDLTHTSRSLAMGQREQGLQPGHSDISAAGPLGQALQARLTLAAHTHDGKIRLGLEEAYLQTRQLPAGFQLRAGRFASQIGYLNEQHPHADDFAERPLLYRAFLGGHWFDDGLRLNWTAPTPFYLRTGLEVFSGRQLMSESGPQGQAGALTLSAKIGQDWGTSSSWQLGAAWLHNRRAAGLHTHAAEDEHDTHENGDHAGHGQAHGAAYSGRHTTVLDAIWKWSPGGNNREQQLRLVGEWAKVRGIHPLAGRKDTHNARSLMAVWRWSAAWETGARLDWLRARSPHEDHVHTARLREQALMVAYKPGHSQTLRLQLSRQGGAQGIENASRRTLQLQYVLSLGAHGAHSF